jgi:cholesterol transport system auxiliary component
MKRALLLLVVFACGCALLGKSDPILPRYFTPEYEGAPRAVPPRADLELRIGRIESWAHLRERIVVRRAGRELIYRDDLRWTELPEVYLRRALTRALFEERGVTESIGGRGVTLDLELIAFEELELAKQHGARLELLLTLRDERRILLVETITTDAPIAAGSEADAAQALTEALSQALRMGVARVADRVVARLDEAAIARPPSPPGNPSAR